MKTPIIIQACIVHRFFTKFFTKDLERYVEFYHSNVNKWALITRITSPIQNFNAPSYPFERLCQNAMMVSLLELLRNEQSSLDTIKPFEIALKWHRLNEDEKENIATTVTMWYSWYMRYQHIKVKHGDEFVSGRNACNFCKQDFNEFEGIVSDINPLIEFSQKTETLCEISYYGTDKDETEHDNLVAMYLKDWEWNIKMQNKRHL